MSRDVIASRRKELDPLDYLDLYEEPAVHRSATPHSRMHSQYTCDCYCKTRVPINHQRDEIRGERDHARSESKPSSVKTDLVGDRKKILWRSAVPLDEEMPDSKKSSGSSPSTEILSPETSNALENAERIMKDVQMQLTEISMASKCLRGRGNINLYSDDPPLDDANDQLLYVRELVASKFQEANSWPDEDAATSKTCQLLLDNENTRLIKKRTDLSAPKFHTTKRPFFNLQKCEYFMDGTESKESSPDEFPVYASSNEKDVEVKQIRSPGRNFFDPNIAEKMNTFSIQIGPSVIIERELVAQNLEDVHISPDPSFVQENSNVATYKFHHDFCEKNSSTIRKEKIIKIIEPNDNNTARILMNEEKKNSTKIDERLKNSAKGIVDQEMILQSSNDEAMNHSSVPSTAENLQTKVKLQDVKLDAVVSKNNVKIPEEHTISKSDVLPNYQSQRTESLLTNEEKRQRENEERHRIIDQRFVEILETHGDSGKFKVNDHRNSLNVDSTKGDIFTDDTLYEPAINQIDNLLTIYNKKIDDISRTTKIVGKFLSRPELAQYSTFNDETRTSAPLSSQKVKREPKKNPMHFSTKHAVESKAKSVIQKSHSNKHLVANTGAERKKKRDITKTSRKLVAVRNKPRKPRRCSTLKEFENESIEETETFDAEPPTDFNNKKELYMFEPATSSNVTISSINPSSPDANGKVYSDEEENLSQIFSASSMDQILEKSIICKNDFASRPACSEPEKGKDLQKNVFDLSTFDNIIQSGSLAKSNDPPNIPEQLISCLFQEERQEAEDKFADTFKKPEISSAVIKSLLKNLLASQGASECTQEMPKFQNELKSGTKPEEDNLQKVCQKIEENVDAIKMTNRDEKNVVEEYSSEMHLENTSQSKATDILEDQSSERGDPNKLNSKNSSKQSERNSNESINEIGNIRSDENHIKNSENIEPQNSVNLKINVDNDELKSCEKYHVSINVDKNSTESTSKNGETNLPISENKKESGLKSTTVPDEVKDTEKSSSIINESPARISSSADSLRDCLSLHTSSLKESPAQINSVFNVQTDEISKHENVSRQETIIQKKSNTESDKNETKELFHSVCATGNSLPTNLKLRSINSGCETESTKADSNSSRSEGELFMPSSCSYSLGEVRMLRKNNTIASNSTEQENTIAVFVTKSMLTSWNESSNVSTIEYAIVRESLENLSSTT